MEPCTEYADFSGARMMPGMLAYSPGMEGMLLLNTSGREEDHSNQIGTAASLPLCKDLCSDCAQVLRSKVSFIKMS